MAPADLQKLLRGFTDRHALAVLRWRQYRADLEDPRPAPLRAAVRKAGGLP